MIVLVIQQQIYPLDVPTLAAYVGSICGSFTKINPFLLL